MEEVLIDRKIVSVMLILLLLYLKTLVEYFDFLNFTVQVLRVVIYMVQMICLWFLQDVTINYLVEGWKKCICVCFMNKSVLVGEDVAC